MHPKCKISSLYAFDALCRAARHQVMKQGLTVETKSETGNAFTFLTKVEGILDGLIEDMATCDVPEAKVGRQFRSPLLTKAVDCISYTRLCSPLGVLML